MKTTHRIAALTFATGTLLAACTGGNGAGIGGGGPGGTGATGANGGTGGTGGTGPDVGGPTPVETFTGSPGTAVYSYSNAGLTVTLDVDGTEGTFRVENGTDRELPEPDFYILDARDGDRIDGELAGPAPIPAGETATFDASFTGIEVRNIGAVVLLFGQDNYGLFVRTG